VAFAVDRAGDDEDKGTEAVQALESEAKHSDPATYALFYEEAMRAIDQQRQTLADVRARAGVLLSGLVLAASFMASASVRDQVNVAGVLATVFFIASTAVLVALLRAKRGWRWGVDLQLVLGTYIEGDPPATLAEIHRSRAYYVAYDDLPKNEDKLDAMHDLFGLASTFGVAAVVFWLMAIAQQGGPA
jgi:hypothetical protein